MTRTEVMEQLSKIAPQLLQKGFAKMGYLNKKPLRKLPKKMRSKYTIEGQETIVYYFPHLTGWSAWIKFRMDAEVAGKIWKDYPMYALVEWVNGSFADIIIHRKHSLDRYNQRLHLGLSNVYDILEEMSYSDCQRVYNFKEVEGDLRFLIANSPNGLFLGFFDRNNSYKEVYTFITDQMVKDGQKPEPTDDLMEAIANHEKKLGRGSIIDVLQILTK
ncbi:hypothetical protein [Chryseotalea sanaruensis]|nr:hypothetical protein [Chryseotalea sanaruensis]